MPASESPLLSIILPTKNRQHTCMFAIQSVLLLNKDDIEIIVQDCSDSDLLGRKILEKFGNDPRIRYAYTDSKPSMTDNWNMAFQRSTGQYKCGIGDDDAVLPNIYDITTWAKKNGIDAIGHSKKYSYFWSDYTLTLEYASKLVVLNSPTHGGIKLYDKNDLDHILKVQAKIPDMNYRLLPMAYHCLLSNSLINELINKTGKFLDGTSLDVYSAFAFGLLLEKFYVLETPFTLPGACGTSNSNRALTKNLNAHFSEFKKIDADKRIPQIYNLTFTIAESTQKALRNLNANNYRTLLDLPYLYADILNFSTTWKTLQQLKNLMKENSFDKNDYLNFTRIFILKKNLKVRLAVNGFVKKLLSNISFLKEILRQRELKNVTIYDAKNILESIEIIQQIESKLPSSIGETKT